MNYYIYFLKVENILYINFIFKNIIRVLLLVVILIMVLVIILVLISSIQIKI